MILWDQMSIEAFYPARIVLKSPKQDKSDYNFVVGVMTYKALTLRLKDE